MKNILITEKTFHRLEKMVTSFNDSPETVITRLLDQYDKSKKKLSEFEMPEVTNRKLRSYSSEIIPKLRFAKLLDASFDDIKPEKNNWNEIVKLALIRVMETCNKVNELKRISGANVVAGSKGDKGYNFIPTHDFSYQKVNSINAAEIVQRCAGYLECNAYLEFEWRFKEGAFNPGERAILFIP